MEVNKHINFLKRRGFLIKESNQMDLDFFKDVETVEPKPKVKKPKMEKSKVNLGPELDLGVDKIDTSVVDSDNIINIRGLCNRAKLEDSKKDNNSSLNIYCRVLSEIERNHLDYDKIAMSLDTIYHFFRPGNDNRTKFHGLINHILDDGGYMEMNTIHLLADYLKKIESSRDPKTMDAINRLKSETEPIQTSVELENLLKKVKTTEYSEYEESFVGDHFEASRTGLSLPYKDSGDETLTNLLQTHIEQGSSGTDKMKMVYTLFDKITKMTDLKSLIKADLICTNPLMDKQGHIIISKGEFVEVKKLDLHGDSYLSEFFAIYKNSDIGDFANESEYYDLYNQTIDVLLQLVRQSTWGQSVLEAVSSQFAGIIYKDGDLDRFVPSDDIEIYWSNAGQPKCKNQRRLAIRYRVKSGKRSSYIYNHDGTMSHDYVNVQGYDKIICEPNKTKNSIEYPKRVNEDSVNDRQGKEWDRESSQGKMIRTKGGTKELDNDFDWAIQQAEATPDDPKIEALIKHFDSASEVIGEDFNEDVGGWYGNHTVMKLQNGEEWVVGDETSMGNALYEYFEGYIDDVGIEELGVDLSDYVNVSEHWISNFCEDEASNSIDDMTDEEILDTYDHYDIMADIEELAEKAEDMKKEYDELGDTLVNLKQTLQRMETENQDYTQYGFSEPPHDEETMDDAREYVKERIGRYITLEEEIEYDLEEEKSDLVERLRDEVKSDSVDDCERCMQDPVDCIVNDKGWYRTGAEAIDAFGWDIDRERLINYFMEDGYDAMSSYDGVAHEEYVDGHTYILIRVN